MPMAQGFCPRVSRNTPTPLVRQREMPETPETAQLKIVWLNRGGRYDFGVQPITALVSRNSSKPCRPHSRPLPDCL